MKRISVVIFAMILVMNVSGCKKEEAAKTVANNGIINFMTGDVTATIDGTKKPEVLVTLGAGDIDELVEPIKKLYKV